MPITPSTASSTPAPSTASAQFVLSTSVPGLTARPIPMMRDSWPCELVLDDVRLPPDDARRRGGAGAPARRRLAHQGATLVRGTAVGVAEEAMRLAADWARERQTFGAALSTRQAIRIAFADSRMEVNAARCSPGRRRGLPTSNDPRPRRAAAIAKVTATESGFRVVDRMMQVLGAMGLARELPLESWFRGLRSARVDRGIERDPARPDRARDELA